MRIQVQEKGSIGDLLCLKLHPASKRRIRQLLRWGAVTLDGKIADRGDLVVHPGQIIEIRKTPRTIDDRSPVPILFEDDSLIAVVKPAGLLSIATDQERSKTLYKMLNQHLKDRSRLKERIFIVHRLDREVSGIMLFAKNLDIQEILQRGWSRTEKVYYALVEGRPPQERGTLRTWLREDPAHKTHSGPEGPEARLAITHYRQVRVLPEHTLLEIRLETGRKHQIRAHLSELGCPVVGDRRYGARPSPIRRLGLCAQSLSFDHPLTGRRVRLNIPIPRVMREFRGED